MRSARYSGVAHRDRRDVFRLARPCIEFRYFRPARAVNDLRVQRIRRSVAVLDDAHRVPVAERDLAVVAAARNAHRSALLLPRAQRGRETYSSWPRDTAAPSAGCTTNSTSRPSFTLTSAPWSLTSRMMSGILRIDPDVLVVVAARRAAKPHPRLPAIARAHGHDARAVHHVGILRVDSRHRQVAAADLQRRPRILGDLRPVLARIIGAVHAQARARCASISLSCVVDTVAYTRFGSLGAMATLICTRLSGSPFFNLLPGLAAIGRFEQSRRACPSY